jgi:hypothetical protein
VHCSAKHRCEVPSRAGATPQNFWGESSARERRRFTSFTFFLHLFRRECCDSCARNTARNFFRGWSDPMEHFGHGTVCKSGVAPAQHSVLPASKLRFLLGANSSPCGTCAMATVGPRVTGRVLCVFHARVTLPCWRTRQELFEIVGSSNIKEASKTEKGKHKFDNPDASWSRHSLSHL